MKSNAKMQKRLENLHDFMHSLALDDTLCRLLTSPLLEVDGCFFLEEFWIKSPHASSSSFPDQTGLECFINHLHIEDYIDSRDALNRLSDLYLAHGFLFATHLKEKLAASRPERCFRIIIAAADGTCTVRFHALREGERWLSDNLEGYREEAVGFIDTKSM
jgi:hypothetical protein